MSISITLTVIFGLIPKVIKVIDYQVAYDDNGCKRNNSFFFFEQKKIKTTKYNEKIKEHF